MRGVRNATLLAAAVAVAHGVNDLYAAFLPPLLPRIMGKLGLNIAGAAALAMTLSLAASALQPVMGWLADRYGRKLFVVGGPLLSVVFLSLVGAAPVYWVLVLFLALGGLGSAAFHPPGASLAARAAEGRGSGARLSYFSFGGAAGYAIGPLVAVAVVGAVGLDGLWLAMLPGLAVLLVVYLAVPGGAPRAGGAPSPSLPRVARRLAGPLGLIFGISVVGAFMQRVFLTLVPIIVAQAGGTEGRGALLLSAYLAGSAAGSLTGGFLTDRVPRPALMATLLTLAVPAHTAALVLPVTGVPVLAAAALAGLVNMAVLPPVVIVAQELVPEGAATTSGIVMGLAWAVASVAMLGAGALGDVIGPRSAALACVPALLLGTVLALHPALRSRSRPVEA